MSNPRETPDPNREVDALGVDPDIVTNDHDPAIDEFSPGEDREEDADERDLP